MAGKNDPAGLGRVSGKEINNYGKGPKVPIHRGPVGNPNDGKSRGGGINRPTRTPGNTNSRGYGQR